MNVKGIPFEAFTADDLDAEKDPTLGNFNRKLAQLTETVNRLSGARGPIPLGADIDMGGNKIRNVGPASSSTDVLTQRTADPMYGADVQQQNMEAVGDAVLKTTRRLNDGTQQHTISSDLKSQGSIPPTSTGSMTYTGTVSSVTWSWTGLQIKFADLSIVAIPDGNQTCTGLTSGSTYFFYPYYDTKLGVVIFVADSVNAHGTPPIAFSLANQSAAIVQHADGHVPLSNGGMQGTSSAISGGGGGGGGTCIFGGMFAHSQSRGITPMRELKVGEMILSRNKLWTEIVKKRTGVERSWVRVALSNKESILVTPAERIPLFDGNIKKSGELCLDDLMRGVGKGVDEIPVQIMELSPVAMEADWVSIGCEPYHEFLVGSMIPKVFAHNIIVKP